MLVIKNSKVRFLIKILVIFIIAPTISILGTILFEEKKHLFISFCIVFLSLLVFITGFEKKTTGTRRMVIVSIMTALSVVGRLIPIFKPVTAITIIAGIYLGGESGFLVGSLSAFISNFYCGQGPWTAFQMLAWGLIGFISGILSPLLIKNKPILLIYGVLTGIVFSFIMDVWTVLWQSDSFNFELYLSAIITALPHTIIYSISNFLFLLLMAKPIGDKLNRIKIKYGI